MNGKNEKIDDLCINTIRFLAVDAIQAANSGHPGMPLGAAPAAYALWDRFLMHNPANPGWPNRDRFILSAGHASSMLYALLHLAGYDLPMSEIRNFRQWDSLTPGHPERGLTDGVEMTTGPLGQGLAHAVGLAAAESMLAAQYNTPDFNIVDHFTYALVSDGDMQEGLSSEVASLAGTWKLGKLIMLYDDNGIQIEGSTSTVFTEDVAARFRAFGWHVIDSCDGFDCEEVSGAIQNARENTGQPSLIICKTVIGYGSPWENTAKVHGSPLGDEGVRTAKEKLGWPVEPAFHVPDDARERMRSALEKGGAAENEWMGRMREYAAIHPDRAASLEKRLQGNHPDGWDAGLGELFPPDGDPAATRSASGKTLNFLAPRLESLTGGSADLAPSNNTILEGLGDYGAGDYAGRNMHFGVREHAMAGIAGGMALHGGFVPYTATFLTFSDYMRPAIRLAALMGTQVVYVFTHDSIGVGEDGPTHQPIEHIMSLRLIPGLTVIRPADAAETAETWRAAVAGKNGPTALVLTRQKVPSLEREGSVSAADLNRGAYILWQSSEKTPGLVLIGTGSEVSTALEAGKALAAEGVDVRVVSMPSWELFEQQPKDYRDSVLPPETGARVSVEAGVTTGWERYTGFSGDSVGIDRYGASAPANIIYEKFGLTPESVAARARKLL